jgi:hypothetical protein
MVRDRRAGKVVRLQSGLESPPDMTRFFDVDAANEALTEVGPLLATLSDQRLELIRLRDRSIAAHSAAGGGSSEVDEGESYRLRLRMKGIVDQMAAAVARLDQLGITLRDIEHGLIDFPALARGRQVWLCWQLGEADVAFWHELDTGFGSRRPLIELM